jgi:MurNAc alpha-1-phosphate uridylyltransferase
VPSSAPIETAMVLAAGLGKRMKPLTDTMPKPMVPLAGTPLIGHTMDRLVDAGVKKAVVNLHYMGEQIKDYLSHETRLEIVFSEEPEILETGGGVANAMTDLGTSPFYCANADAFWLNGFEDALGRLAERWNDDEMDGLLMLHSTVDGYGYTGVGDFMAEADGKLCRRPDCEIVPWLFTGVQILHPRLFDGAPEGAFSLNVLYDKAMEAERLFGIVHDGEWFHIGTPDGLAVADAFLDDPYPGSKKR